MTDEVATPGDQDSMPTHAKRLADYIEQVAASQGLKPGTWMTAHGLTPSNFSNWKNEKTPHIEIGTAEELGRALGLSALAVLRIAGYDLALEDGQEPPPLPVPPVSLDEAIKTAPDPYLTAQDRVDIRNYVDKLRIVSSGGRLTRTPRRKPKG